MIYIYGAARSVDPVHLPDAGVFGGALQTISGSDLDLIVEEVASAALDGTLGEGARGNEALLHSSVLSHQGVLNDLVGVMDLLPFRFGTVVSSHEDAASLLAEQKTAFDAALEQIAGHLEWGIKITRTAAKKEAPKAASGANYLRQLSAQKQSVTDTQTEVADLCKAVAATVQDGSKAMQALPLRSNDNTETRILNLAYLLPRGGEGAMGDAINATVGRFSDLPVLIEISGPWPAFSFAATDEADAS